VWFVEQIGQVVDIKNDRVVVMVRRHDVCDKCGGCGAAISGSGENFVEAMNTVNAVVGQTVKVSLDTMYVLKASFMVYIVPVFALLLGIYAGQVLDGAFGILARFDIILGVVFLVGSYLIVRRYDRKMADGRVSTMVVEIIDEPNNGPKDQKC
jgi:sigma-E factor negative regulatory protein RseC